MKNLNKKAFSLIELSIVILIIGIIIAGVTQSSRLISAYKLQIAEGLTTSSPVASIKNLVLWLESTSSKSFKDAETQDGSKISVWYDINPQTSYPNNASQDTSDARPQYSSNCINNLPCLNFDGVGTFVSFDGTSIVNSNYSVIVVEERKAAGTNFFLAGTGSTDNSNLLLGYRGDTNPTFGQYNNDYDIAIDAFSNPIPRIHTYIFNSLATTAKTYHINGAAQTLVSAGGSPVMSNPLTSFEGASVGRFSDSGPAMYFNGAVGEVIIFNRALRESERTAIEAYLGKKWNIAISS